MKGSVVIGGLLGIAGAMGLGLWYSIQTAYYDEVEGVTEVMAYGDAFPVSNYKGIDADTSPLKLRACFTVDWDYFPIDVALVVVTHFIPVRFYELGKN